MSFKDNVNLHVDKSAKLINFSDDLLEHLKRLFMERTKKI